MTDEEELKLAELKQETAEFFKDKADIAVCFLSIGRNAGILINKKLDELVLRQIQQMINHSLDHLVEIGEHKHGTNYHLKTDGEVKEARPKSERHLTLVEDE